MPVTHYIMLDLINQLISHNQACHTCLRTSAMAVADLSLRAELQSYAKTHEALVAELGRITARLDLSAAHHQLQNITAAMPGRSSFQYAYMTQDRYAILAECQDRLRQALSCYDQIMQAKLPEWFAEALSQQAQSIEKAFHHIHHMCQTGRPQFSRKPVRPADAASILNANKNDVSNTQGQDDMLVMG